MLPKTGIFTHIDLLLIHKEFDRRDQIAVELSKIGDIIKLSAKDSMDTFNPHFAVAISAYLDINSNNPCAEVLNNNELCKYILGTVPSLNGQTEKFYMMTIDPQEPSNISLIKFNLAVGKGGRQVDIQNLELEGSPIEFSDKTDKLEKSLVEGLKNNRELLGDMAQRKSAILNSRAQIQAIMTKVQIHHTPPDDTQEARSQYSGH
jgi:hypothetical protein